MSDREYDNRQTIIIRANTDKDGSPRTAKWADYKGSITDQQGTKWYADLWIHNGKYGEFLSGTWNKQAEDKPQYQRGGGFKRPAQAAPAYTPPPGFAAPQLQQVERAAQQMIPADPNENQMIYAVMPNGERKPMPRGTANQLGLFIDELFDTQQPDVPQ